MLLVNQGRNIAGTYTIIILAYDEILVGNTATSIRTVMGQYLTNTRAKEVFIEITEKWRPGNVYKFPEE